MTAMSMIVAGAVFAQEKPNTLNNESKPAAASSKFADGTVTTLYCNQITLDYRVTPKPLRVGQSVINTYTIPYAGGTAGPSPYFDGIPSYGATGLYIANGSDGFVGGSGNKLVIVYGTPSSSGIANFPITLGGKSCIVSLTVYP